MKLGKKFRALALAVPLAIGGTVALSAAPASAATQYPRTGWNVTYYDCRGPFYTSWGQKGWDCYADYNWYAELTGQRDGYQVVFGTPWTTYVWR